MGPFFFSFILFMVVANIGGRSVETFARTAERADEYGLDIILLATSESSKSPRQVDS